MKALPILQGYQDEMRTFWQYLLAVKYTNAIYLAGNSFKKTIQNSPFPLK